MNRVLAAVGVVALLAGGFLLGWSLFRGGEEADPASRAYVEADPCADCPVTLRSVEVQERQGSTLFVVRGDWPSSISQIPGDVLLQGSYRNTGFAVPLTAVPEGMALADVRGLNATEVVEPLPPTVAVGLQGDAFLLNLREPAAPNPPFRFTFTVETDVGESRLPTTGVLAWDGFGAPVREAAGQAPAQPTTEPTVESETPEEFAALLAEAHREGNRALLLQRLHPEVIRLYGEDQCSAFLQDVADPTREYVVQETGQLAPWPYNPDGRTIPVQDIYTVTVRATVQGQTSTQELHFGVVAQELRWFTDCGDPLS